MSLSPPPISSLPERKTSRLAVAAFILSLFCWTVLTLPVSLIMGMVARHRIKRSPETLKGESWANAAIVFSGLPLVFLLLFSVQRFSNGVSAEKARQSIHVGMSLNEVEKVLTDMMGLKTAHTIEGMMTKGTARVFVHYEALKDGKWDGVQREEFLKLLPNQTETAPASCRLAFSFRTLPGTTATSSFEIEFDGTGKVSNISQLRSWD